MFDRYITLHNRYQLLQQLGRTAAGRQTWLAADQQSNKQVIVKLLAFSPQLQWQELELFEREAETLKTLDHPRIPDYRDFFALDREVGQGLPWFGLVQSYIAGESLQTGLDQGRRLTEAQVRSIATQVLDILSYLHHLSPPVLHRDLKPSNLIMDEREKVYLVDFGAVQAQAAVTGITFTVVGTSGYAPLEQFWGRAVPASDLYGLGASLIHLLTGIAPADLPQRESRLLFRDRTQVSEPLADWLEKLTHMSVEQRFPTAEVALAALQNKMVPASSLPPAPSRRRARLSSPHDNCIQMQKSKDYFELRYPLGGLIRQLKAMGLKFHHKRRAALILGCICLTVPPLALLAGAIHLFILQPRSIRLILDHNHLEIRRRYWRLDYQVERGFVDGIVAVFLSQYGSTFQVCIRGQDNTYQLGGALTENEAIWLLQAIEDWLEYGE
jgi:serine/threonine protein kinase